MSNKLRELKSLIESNIRGVEVDVNTASLGSNNKVIIKDKVDDVEYFLKLEEAI